MSDHFSIIDGAITPASWMQERLVAAAAALSVSHQYAVSGGGNKNDLVQTVVSSWTNDSDIAQWVHGIVTRGSTDVTLQARSRGYLSDRHAVLITATPSPAPVAADYDMVEVSRAGGGMDVGKGGSLGVGTGFAVAKARSSSTSTPLMPHSPGMYRVEPGETIWGRVDVRFISEFWENTSIDGGSSSTESSFISGTTRIDLYAIPAIVDPGPRPTPTVVGVEHDIEVSGLLGEVPTEVDVPAGVAEGDVIVAATFNQWGLFGDIDPVEPGWTLVHGRDAGWQNTHAKIWLRSASADEPDTYSFTNALVAEQVTFLIVLRDASLLLDDGWFIASNLRKYFWERDEGHVCPSIDRAGGLLLCFSYFAHALGQSPITQQPPDGMTELADVPGVASTCAVAVLADPPKPTGERAFTPSKEPQTITRSITVTMLVPGTRPA
ncbi:MAG: hypothetical protein CMK98_13515 [Pseudomonas sp.]|nr:hypothetical protein [Pseudomonas sp.]